MVTTMPTANTPPTVPAMITTYTGSPLEFCTSIPPNPTYSPFPIASYEQVNKYSILRVHTCTCVNVVYMLFRVDLHVHIH